MQTHTKNLRSLLRHSASAFAVAAACFGATALANASTVTLTSANSPYAYDGETGNVIEVTSGTKAYQTASYNSIPDGYLGLVWSSTPSVSSTTADTIKVDSGASLYIDNPWGWQQPTSLYNVEGDTTIAHGWSLFMGTNSFLGDITVEDSATVEFGALWGVYPTDATTYFGTSTDISIGSGSTIYFVEPHSMSNTISTISSKDSTALVKLINSTLILDGANTASSAYYGTFQVYAGATLQIGDSTHSTAVFGDPTASAANVVVYQSSGTLGTLSGYGTLYGSVTSDGIVRPGGTSGTAGTLTVVGNYAQNSGAELAIEVTPTGVSKLAVSGTATVDGTLLLNVNKGEYGNNIYTILTADSISGSFDRYKIAGDTSSAIVGFDISSSGYSLVTERGGSAQIVSHALNANRSLIASLTRNLYDQIASNTGTVKTGEVYAWAQPFARFDDMGRDGVGYDVKYGGLTGGAEYRFTDMNAVVGGSFTYARGSMDVKNEASKLTSDTFNLAIYGGADLQYARVDGVAFVDFYDADSKRDIGSYGKAKSSPSGMSYGVSFQISRDLFDNLITPYARGSISRHHVNGKTESGDEEFVLDFDDYNQTAFSGDIGVRVHVLTPTPDLKIKWDVTAGVSHDFTDMNQTISGEFAKLSDSAFSVTWRGNSANSLQVGTEFSDTVSDGIEIFARLNGQFTTYERAGDFFVGGRYKF